MNLSRSFSFRPARGSIYIINHKLSTTRSTNRCAAVQIRLEQSSTPTIQDYKQRVSTINWDHSIVNEDLILFSYQMHSFSLVTSCPWKESCKIFKATLQTPRTLTLRSPGTSRTPWNSKDFKAFGLTAESYLLPNPGTGYYPEAHRSYDKLIYKRFQMEYLKPCLRMEQEERIRNLAWIRALWLQLPLLELVCAGDVQRGRQP